MAPFGSRLLDHDPMARPWEPSPEYPDIDSDDDTGGQEGATVPAGNTEVVAIVDSDEERDQQNNTDPDVTYMSVECNGDVRAGRECTNWRCAKHFYQPSSDDDDVREVDEEEDGEVERSRVLERERVLT